MDIRHVNDCEYCAREDDIECKGEIKKVMENLLYERKKNFQEQDSYCNNPKIRICPNVYCNIYTDLYNWFGFKNCRKIDTESLNTCFTDITNGGVGYYEKLIVLGGRVLELYSELHFFNKYNYEKEEEIAKDLKNIKSIKEVVYHYLYVQKRKNRVIYRNSIYLFGYSYLYTPLFFNNKNSIIKYVKACIAYAVKYSGANIFSWMPTLIEHIYHSQKLKVSEIERENELIQDLQEYLGYQFDYILPRIAECFSYHNLYISNSDLTGLQIIRIFANEYFSLLADDVNIHGPERTIWVREETEAFLNSNCIEIFSGCTVSVSKYLNEGNVKIGKVRNIFEMLLSSCWVLGNEKRNKIWVSALIQRLRQVQLLTQITTIEKWSYSIKKYNDMNISNFVKDIYNFNNINGSILSPFQLQNVNIYLPPKQSTLKQIPYYTTLADKYKECFHQDDNKVERKKDCHLYNVLNNITNNMYNHFKPRRQKNVQASTIKRVIHPQWGDNFQGQGKKKTCIHTHVDKIYMSYCNLKENVSSRESSSFDIDNEDTAEYQQFNTKKKNEIKKRDKNNGIPVKIKYIKDSKDDGKSKYIIEIPEKDLKAQGSNNHIKAVLWGNSKKGLEIKLPVDKNTMSQMKIKKTEIF
ncbi:hypothetical protein POVCU2_0022610 [Plasmodium ovale curtisi]|uniref:Uncharacterized protein n=1 Tax=Plasmodium ovale curtisi TaxID=864141 RepID=A0A1A8VWL6_PLAOA|nr:hypothetical protein POVCU2_0022610 [Plasmodium ovale curtisi]SBS91376.1 hypothetical protein POVCU1_020530 [Plasmodium ovale curtisi]